MAEALALALFGLAALAVSLHALALLHLLLRRPRPAVPVPLGDDLPVVTVQLPLFNEPDVAGALLRCVAALDWPPERLQIQVLDDSTDETPGIVAAEVEWMRRRGLAVQHLRRAERTGFKAGALAEGLQTARGELIAILDADFRPRPDWLRQAVACLAPDVGLVQCRWSFRNADASLLTRAQALHLDAHFAVEQQARSAGLFMGFNGTAGVWRRAAIDAAGGWEGDTLTEDLDLAYRAQLAGWRLRYVDDIDVPSDLPDQLGAVRSQQHRWIRGGAQVARKLLLRLWRSRQPLQRKLHGTAHLLASSVFLPVLLLCLLAPVLAFVPAGGVVGVLLRGVLGVLVLVYGTACVRRAGWGGLWRLVRDLPVFLVLVTAICVHDAHAAWLGWTAGTGTFVRTPKGSRVVPRRLPPTLPMEALVAVWSWVGLVAAVARGQWGGAAFLSAQALGFSGLVVASFLSLRREAAPVAARL